MDVSHCTAVALMKAQVLEDIDLGRVPASVASFEELHTFVDANCYGDFCDDDVFDALTVTLGADGRDLFIGECQQEIDRWLRAGRL